MGLEDGLEAARSELVDLVVANNLSTTLILGRLCQSYGTIRPATIRTQIKFGVREREPKPVILLWADEFRATLESEY